MTNTKNASTANDNVSTDLSKIESEIDFIKIDFSDAPFSFINFTKLMDDIAGARDMVARSEFSTEEERKALNKASALTNKVNRAFKNELRDAKATTFARADEQVAEIAASLNGLNAEIKERVEHFNNKYRQDKTAFVMSKITERLDADPALAGTNAGEFFNAAWLNRTATETSIVRELEARFTAVEAVAAVLAPTDGDQAVTKAVAALGDHEFDTATTISALMAERAEAEARQRAEAEAATRRAAAEAEAEARMRERLAAEAEEKRQREEARRAEAEAAAQTVNVTVAVPRDQVQWFRTHVTDDLGWALTD